jgi:hypothetical protein
LTRAIVLFLAIHVATACSQVEPRGGPRVGSAEINWDGPWAVAQGQYEGSPLFVRIHQGVSPLVGDPRFSQQVGIAVPLLNPDAHGLPTNEEAAQLAEIEDAISAALEPNHISVQVLSITTKGMREFVFYTTDADAVRTAFAQLQASIVSHELQLVIQRDPDWSVYRQFKE